MTTTATILGSDDSRNPHWPLPKTAPSIYDMDEVRGDASYFKMLRAMVDAHNERNMNKHVPHVSEITDDCFTYKVTEGWKS